MYAQRPPLEIDRVPLKAESLAHPEAAERHQHEGRIDLGVPLGRQGEEEVPLLRGHRLHGLADPGPIAHLGCLRPCLPEDSQGGIRGDHFVLDGETEGG